MTTTALLALVVLLVASLLQLIMASGHPHNNYINNGGLIPFPQLSVEAILNKILVWIRKNSTVSIPPHKEEGNNLPDESDEDSRRYLQDRRR